MLSHASLEKECARENLFRFSNAGTLMRTYFSLQVFLVYRSGGKPSDEHIGLGAKKTGAKFISRSHARPLNNPVGAASAASHLHTTNIGKCIHPLLL